MSTIRPNSHQPGQPTPWGHKGRPGHVGEPLRQPLHEDNPTEYLYRVNYNHPSPSGVYMLLNIRQGKGYVGSTKNLTARISHHFRLLEEGVHPNRDMQHSFTSYGPVAWSAIVLERCSYGYLTSAEQKWINRLRHMLFNRQYQVVRPQDREVSFD